MIRLIAILLISGISMQLFSKHLVLVDYLINRSYIASVLCEKKLVPENDCKGKCQLNKQLKKETEREQNSPRNVNAGIDLIFTLQQKTAIDRNLTFIRHYFHFPESKMVSGFAPCTFHPPTC